ncbi:hypothetical protein HJFPF1_05354 [Paramyrothecium foliicola]|nr:hypothetical protein HJFPF1_05354 [Paramyrothecium foliicola]
MWPASRLTYMRSSSLDPKASAASALLPYFSRNPAVPIVESPKRTVVPGYWHTLCFASRNHRANYEKANYFSESRPGSAAFVCQTRFPVRLRVRRIMHSSTFFALVLAAVASAHIVISYPGWRGNNLISNETFPYGMQWMFPCGGLNYPRNHTYWPISGGAIAFQPGWFKGHETAFVYVNMGFGTDGPYGGPHNMTHPMVSPFQILGPSNGPYPGTVCLTQVPLPKNASVEIGDRATIQIVELAIHGAALYSCVDIEFTAPGDPRVAEVNDTNCFNTTELGFAEMFTITTKTPGINPERVTGAAQSLARFSALGWLPLLVMTGSWLLL